MNASDLRILQADHRHREAVDDVLRAMRAEESDPDKTAAADASEGFQRSLSRFDALDSDCVWLLIAYIQECPAGLAVLTRVPKLDERVGFLVLDELHVIRRFRRKGIGKALLSRCVDLAREQGLAGVRLLARIDNEPARRLYESAGFEGTQTMLYQYPFDHPDTTP
jgi:ribosomal protein S18 acetylase RimI-like enzyme